MVNDPVLLGLGFITPIGRRTSPIHRYFRVTSVDVAPYTDNYEAVNSVLFLLSLLGEMSRLAFELREQR